MSKPVITIQDLAKLNIVGDPQMSPDGARVIYTVKISDAEKKRPAKERDPVQAYRAISVLLSERKRLP